MGEQVFKIEYSEKRRRFVYVRIYSGTCLLYTSDAADEYACV